MPSAVHHESDVRLSCKGVRFMDNPVTHKEFMDKIEKMDSRIDENEKQIAVIKASIKNWEKLPESIASLDKTMALMQQNLCQLNEKVGELATREKQIEENSKIDIVATIKSKWWEIVMFAAMATLLFQNFAK